MDADYTEIDNDEALFKSDVVMYTQSAANEQLSNDYFTFTTTEVTIYILLRIMYIYTNLSIYPRTLYPISTCI